MTKQEFINNRFDLKGLREVGFLTADMTYEEIEHRICKRFGLKSIFLYDFIMSDKKNPVKADINTFSSN